jgi:ABC-type Fe3+/spermidine/putrescine transport system ATPase subunit
VAILECRSLSKRFDAAWAVDEVSFAVERGEFFSLLGPSGCGKTTTLRLVAGLEDPDHGDILIDGASARGRPPYDRKLGMVFQHYALFPHLSVERNVAYGLERRQTPPPELIRRVGEALELVKLPAGTFGARRPSQLSGGERQRVALARALVLQPGLLLLDEPLGALDLALRKAMQLELKQLNRKLGISFLYVTHDQEEALTMSDRIAVMHRGKVVQVGTPRQIYEEPRTEFVARFIGESNVLTLRDGRPASVRPERIALTPADGPGPENGVVEEVLYQGERVRVMVALSNGQRLVASLPNDGRPLGTIATRGVFVRALWSGDDAWPLEPEP